MKSTGKVLIIAVALVAIIVGSYIAMRPKPNDGPVTTPGALVPPDITKQPVAMLDAEKIYALPEFQDAKKKIETRTAELTKSLEAWVKAQGQGLTPQALQAKQLEMQSELMDLQASVQKPLMDRVSRVIALVANEKKVNVVLDKRIVVSGVMDITDDVARRFEAEKEPAETPEQPADTIGLAYVNQQAVADLAPFRKANAEMAEYYQELYKLMESNKNRPRSELVLLEQDLERRMAQKREELMSPLHAKVNAIISEVAKEKGLSLVLDSRQVMWGGRNITSDVMEKFLKATNNG